MNKSDHNRPNSRSDEDEILKQLAIAAQNALSQQDRQKIMDQLIQKILRSGRLRKPHRHCFTSRYAEIYEEALQDLFLYMSSNIQKYDPSKASVIGWLNMLMELRFIINASRKVIGKLDLKFGDISDLPDTDQPPEDGASLSELIREYVASDPEKLLQGVHIEGHPGITFQVIFLRWCEKIKWQEMEVEFGIPVPTLSSFFRRNLKKFQPQIQHYIQQHSQFR